MRHFTDVTTHITGRPPSAPPPPPLSATPTSPAVRAEAVIRLEQVSRRYGDITALDQVSLEIQSGQVIAVLGPNGAGKTTLVNLMLGLSRPDRGRITVLGQTPGALAARRHIGVMLQQAELADTLRVHELLQLFSQYYPQPLAVTALLRLAGLEELAQRPYGKLSGGQKRRVQFAIALCGDPQLLFLDEPTTGLDIQARHQLWEQIRYCAQKGRAVVLTTHYLEEADQLADRILVMHGGRIIADGSPQQIKSRIQLRQIRCHSSLTDQHPLLQRLARNAQVHRLDTEHDDHGTRLRLLTTQAEEVARQLLAMDPHLSDLEISGADLEQAFLALTNTPQGDTA